MTLRSRLASCALLCLLISTRLADFWGLHYGNTDDISTDFMRMVLPLSTIIKNYAASQSRIQFSISAPLWTAMMSVAGTPIYDLVNLGMFSLSVLLPLFALRRYFLPGHSYLLYATALFAPLPFLFSYSPPYCYPLWMSFPITCCGLAILVFQHAAHHRWSLVPAFLATFLSLCAYEAATIVSLALLSVYFAASSADRKPLLRRRDLQCVAVAFVCFICIYFPYRLLHPPQYQGVQASAKYLTPASIVRVVGTLSLTSSIYAWFTLPQKAQSIDPPSGVTTIQASLSPQPSSAGLSLALLTTAIAFVLIRNIVPTDAPPGKLAALALLLLVAPNLAYPLTEKIAAPVVNRQLYAYTATAYSQVGLACAIVALAMASTRIRLAPLRIFIAVALSMFLGLGSLAASTFNRESAVFARQQASRWKVIRSLAACASQLPAPVLENLAAPRLWQSATANLSWGDPVQEASYWDALAFDRYGLRTHLIPQPAPGPDVNWLDFHLASNGALQSVVIARSAGMTPAPKSWTITTAPRPSSTACTADAGFHISHLAADPSLTPPTVVAPPIQPPDAPALTPQSGSGMEQTFTLRLSPRDNGVDVRTAGLLINGMELGMDSCYVFWDLLTGDQRLVNDSGEDSTIMGPSGLLQNRHCDFLASQYTHDGGTITLTYHVRFHANFKGLKQIYLFRKNTAGGNTGLKHLGTWWARD